MWTEILGMAVSNGLWAVLFCLLLFYQIKDGRKREARYQTLIDTLTDRLKMVRDIRESVAEIGNDVKEVKAIVLKKKKCENCVSSFTGVKELKNEQTTAIKAV